jgi:hypothetical protein
MVYPTNAARPWQERMAEPIYLNGILSKRSDVLSELRLAALTERVIDLFISSAKVGPGVPETARHTQFSRIRLPGR